MARFALLTFLSLLALPLAGAAECTPTTSDALAVGPYYVYTACQDDSPHGQENCANWGMLDTWVYEETNGIPGLQRGDEMRDDTCGGQIASDTVVL